jgi:exopolysaccharide biosynthesis polyprenyl glycosylphosphotransferase
MSASLHLDGSPDPRRGLRRDAPSDRPTISTVASPALSRRAAERARSAIAGYRAVVIVGDAVLASAMVAAAIIFRFKDAPTGWYVLVPGIFPVAWVTILALYRTYDARFVGAGTEEFNRIARSGMALFIVIAVFSFTTVGNVSRSIVMASVPATVIGSLVVRKIARHKLYRSRAAGHGLQPTLVVGQEDAVEHLVDRLFAAPDQGLEPVGVCVPNADHQTIDGVPVVGTTASVVEAVKRTGATVVAVVSHPELAGHQLRQLSWALEDKDVDLLVSPGIVEVAGPRLSIRPVAGLSLLHLERPRSGVGAQITKGLFDRSGAILALTLLAPVLLGIAVLVKLTSPGPVLFRQTRVGRHGKEFQMVKFRSMVPNAEERLIDLRAQDDGNGVMFKLHSDPRITRLGSILRRFSLDELPQLINVVRGDMSLVGPRPPLPSEVARYEPDAVRRLHVRPGITGLWQVSGRSDLTWEQSLRLDLRYVDNWSMALDLSILWRTIRAVLGGGGAY